MCFSCLPAVRCAGGFSPDGKTVVTAGGEGDGSVRIWEPRTGDATAVVAAGHGAHDAGGGATCLAFAPSGAIVASGGADGATVVVSLGTARAVARLEGVHDDGVEAAVFLSGDGGNAPALVTAGLDGRAVIWDVQASATRATCSHPAAVVALAAPPEGPLFATGATDGGVRIWDARAAACVRTFRGLRAAVQCVAWAPDGQRVLAGSDDCTACVFHLA